MRNKNITKKWVAAIFAAGISAAVLAGCGTSGVVEVEQNDAVAISEIEDTAEEETPDYINAIEERVHKTSFESYDEIISMLEGSEGYAYVNVKGYEGDVLAVSTNTYDDMLGHMASAECTFYTIKKDGAVSADAVLSSSGTATPVAIDDEGVLYTATHSSAGRFCYGMDIPDGVGMICIGQVIVKSFDDDGQPTSIIGRYRTSNTVANDDNLVTIEENDIDFYDKMFDEYYDNSQPIYFTVASPSSQNNEKLIRPILFEINPDNVEDGCYMVKIDKSGISESDGKITIKAEVYKEDTYDIADISNLAEGDAIYLKGEEVPVDSIQWEDTKCVNINGGSDNGGITLSSYRHPDYFRFFGQYEMDRSYSYIETIELNVSDDVKLTDCIDPTEAKEYTGENAILALKEIVEEGPLFYDAGEIVVKNGIIVEIYRNYIP